MSSSVPMKCYVSQAKDLRAKMAGTPDAAQLPTPSGQGSTALDVASQKFESIINTVDAALTKAEEAHEGRAAEIARSSVSAIKPVANNAADFCKSVQNSLDDQASTQHKTFQELPAEGGKLSDGRPAQMEPPDKNWADDTGVSDIPLMGWTSDYEEKQERYRATNEEANRVMAQYEEQTASATRSLPEFKPPEDSDTDASRQADYGPGAGSVVAGSTFGSGAGSGSSVPASSSSAWTAGSGGVGGGSVGGGAVGGGSYAPSGGSGVGGGSYTSQPPASSGSAWVNPSTGGSSGNGLPPGAIRGSDGTIYRQGPDGSWQRQNPYNGRWAPAPNGPPGLSGGGRAGGSGGVGGARGGDGYTGRAGGSGGLGGARGGGGYAGRVGGLGGTGAGEPAAGGRSGTGSFGPKGSGSTVAAGTNAAGGRGGGMRGAPMAGAGARQAGGEEEQHERPSWLVEDEDVFTNDMQRVAPPVLGETPYEQGR